MKLLIFCMRTTLKEKVVFGFTLAMHGETGIVYMYATENIDLRRGPVSHCCNSFFPSKSPSRDKLVHCKITIEAEVSSHCM